MTRRPGLPLYYSRHCGNINKMRVHDLENEKKQCQIDDIIDSVQAINFYPDTLEQAHKEGYNNLCILYRGKEKIKIA